MHAMQSGSVLAVLQHPRRVILHSHISSLARQFSAHCFASLTTSTQG